MKFPINKKENLSVNAHKTKIVFHKLGSVPDEIRLILRKGQGPIAVMHKTDKSVQIINLGNQKATFDILISNHFKLSA